MIRVETGSRLHFGAFQFGGAASGTGRFFGGAGLMVSTPGIRLSVAPAREWQATGPLAARALEFARQFAASFPAAAMPAHHIAIDQAAPEHVGLGTGTQLGLAVAHALAESAGCALDVLELARRTGRGARSAIGIHGFAEGGFLVDAGKQAGEAIAPLAARAEFPDDWRIVLAIPGGAQGLHGAAERQAFQCLHEAAIPLPTEALRRLVLLGILPALAGGDLPAFAETLYEFNHKVGEAFAAVQGGPYASARLHEMVDHLRQRGVRGVAQSSWGPTLAAVVEDDERAKAVTAELRREFRMAELEVVVTSARNQKARLGRT
jgi:beta-RFAP synthase